MSDLEYSNAPISYLKVAGETVLNHHKADKADRETKAKASTRTGWDQLYRSATPRDRERILSLWSAKPEHRSKGSR
jgi:hypothetical protein